MRNIYSLDKNWLFEKKCPENDEKNYIVNSGAQIDLPHSWNKGDNYERGLFVYQKKIDISKENANKRLYLEFLGANSVCRAYLNGEYLGEHRGGYSTFRFEITKAYKWNEENLLSVFVDNSRTKDVSPLNGDFTIYGGLYRDVNLVCVDKNHFSLDYWGTSGIIVRTELDEEKNGIIKLEIHNETSESVKAKYTIYDQNENIIEEITTSADQKEVSIAIDEPTIWNGSKNPYLYKLRASLENEDTIYDEININFAFRECHLDPSTGFYLNGENIKLNGVSKHQDNQKNANAVSEKDVEEDIELIREVGANALRLSHYQHNQFTYDLCDREGLIVWAEIPMLSMPESQDVMQNAQQQLHELILQNIHHPSICFWGIQNEIAMGGESVFMYTEVQNLNDIVHQLAPGSISACANMYDVKNKSQLNYITDMQGYNLYFGWYYGNIEDLDSWIETFHEENPHVALGISEYGADCNLMFHSAEPKVKDYSEEFQSKYHEITYPIINSKSYMWGSFLWNMFDFGSSIRNEGGSKGKNCKGLVTFDRKTKKDAFYFYKANWSDMPFVHICEKRYKNREKDRIDIKVYSNLDSVSLSVNGKEIGTLTGDKKFLFENVELTDKENIVAAYSGNYRDEAVFVKTEHPDESYVFIDPNPEINVKNWFTKEKGEADVFPEDSFKITDTLGDLLENEQAWEVVKRRAPKIAERSTKGAKVTLLWVINKMKTMSEDEVKEFNEELIKIKKR